MADATRERIKEHLHGVAAGSLTSLALFLALAVPLVVVDMVRGGVTVTNVLTLALFVLLGLAAVLEARSWRDRVESREALAA